MPTLIINLSYLVQIARMAHEIVLNGQMEKKNQNWSLHQEGLKVEKNAKI